jgi:hypothetical protein
VITAQFPELPLPKTVRCMTSDKMKRRRGQAVARKQDTASHREGKRCLKCPAANSGRPPGKGDCRRVRRFQRQMPKETKNGEKGFFLLGAALLFRTLSFFSANEKSRMQSRGRRGRQTAASGDATR